MNYHLLVHAGRDVLAIVPWLLGIYIFLELVEHKFGHVLADRISHRNHIAPILGALFGASLNAAFRSSQARFIPVVVSRLGRYSPSLFPPLTKPSP